MTTNSAQILTTLREVQQIVSMAMAATVGDSGSDSRILADLHAHVASFAQQADTVLAQLLESEGGEDLIDVAEALVEFFQGAEAQLAERLAARSG